MVDSLKVDAPPISATSCRSTTERVTVDDAFPFIKEAAVQFDHIAYRVPDVARAVAWLGDLLPAMRVLYQDESWALVEAGGVKIALVQPDQHPDHLAFRVDAQRLAELAAEHERGIETHRDASRGIYLEGPGNLTVELIHYPEPS